MHEYIFGCIYKQWNAQLNKCGYPKIYNVQRTCPERVALGLFCSWSDNYANIICKLLSATGKKAFRCVKSNVGKTVFIHYVCFFKKSHLELMSRWQTWCAFWITFWYVKIQVCPPVSLEGNMVDRRSLMDACMGICRCRQEVLHKCTRTVRDAKGHVGLHRGTCMCVALQYRMYVDTACRLRTAWYVQAHEAFIYLFACGWM